MATPKGSNDFQLAMPQGSFKGPSRDDIIGALSVFFGQAASPEKLSDYTSQHAATVCPPRVPVEPRAPPLTALPHRDAVRLPRRLHRPEHHPPRHDDQPDPPKPADVAHLSECARGVEQVLWCRVL